jgi:hypothetical protein
VVTLDAGRATGARVRLDGAELGVTPLEQQVPAGTHRLQIDRPGYVSFDRDLVVPDDRDVRVRAHLTPHRTRTQRATFWTLQAVATGLAVGGVVFGGLALNDQSSFDSAPTLALGDAGHQHAITADALFAASAAVGIAGAVYYLITWPRAARLENVR